MATLFRNSNSPVWRARYFNADGKRVSQSTGTTSKREATKIANRYEAEALERRAAAATLPKAFAEIVETAAREATAGSLTLARTEELMRRLHKLANPDFQEVTLEDFWNEWIEEQDHHVTDSTARGYREDKAIFAAALGRKVMSSPPRALTSDAVGKALRKSATGRKRATANKALSSLRRVMEAAITKGLATANPAKVTRALDQADSAERAPFTVEEIRRMIDHEKTSDEWHGAILIAAHTGLRLGDIVGLGRGHVEVTRIVIRPAKTAKSRKVVTIPITPPVMAWIGERKGAFFPKLAKEKTSNLSMQFRAIMERAEVPREVVLPGDIAGTRSFHSLRHTFASWLAEADIHADVRQKLTGHSSSRIHQRYTHHDEALDRAVAALPDLSPETEARTDSSSATN